VDDVIRFAVLGLGLGGMYSLAALGIVVIYRGSGVINFAQGAMATAAAFMAWELQENAGWPFLAAFVAGVMFVAVLGMATQLLVMWPLQRASSLARTVATLGLLLMVQSLLGQRYGNDVWLVASALPDDLLRLFGGDVVITEDRLWLLAIAILVTATLWGIYRWTSFGRATTAVAENQQVASSLGWSPNFIATANWGLGCALGGAAGILITPIVGLNVGALTGVVLAALAAALVGGFRSLPLTLAAGLLIGIARSELTRFSTRPGLADSVPFIVIVVVLVISGRALPIRSYLFERLPKIGTGRVRPALVVPLAILTTVLITQIGSVTWTAAIITTMALAMISLSAVVVVGYAGQISLGQFALAGFGAWVAGRLVATTSVPFELAVVIGVLGGVAIGLVFGLPALRTRGVRLAIITLGLGATLHLMIFANPKYTGGLIGTDVGDRTLFGVDIDGIRYPERYAAFVFAMFVLVAIAVANVRRGRTGRRLIAVRTNERAAAALGISPPFVKLYAFALSAAIAALGGILLYFRSPKIVYEYIIPFRSITVLTSAVIGGIGYVLGPVIGAAFLPGAVGAKLIDVVIGFPEEWLTFVGGAFVVLIILRHQDGVADTITNAAHAIGRKLTAAAERRGRVGRGLTLARRITRQTGAGEIEAIATGAPGVRRHRVVPRRLDVRQMSVNYGGVTALRNVNMSIEPGQIVGLIGPNGAGKTTLVDAVSGNVRYTGHVLLDGRSVDRLRAHQRVRAGMTRSFQTLEIFEDLTVADNLRTASDPGGLAPYFRDIIYPKQVPLSDAALACVDEFNILPLLERVPTELSYGQRRLVAIARAVATAPSVLLLDEPAAGLVEWSAMELATLVRRLANDWGMAILVIEHDIRFVMTACDAVLALDFGEEIASGPPEAVRHDPAVVAAYLGDVEQVRTGQGAYAAGAGESDPTRATPPGAAVGTAEASFTGDFVPGRRDEQHR